MLTAHWSKTLTTFISATVNQDVWKSTALRHSTNGGDWKDAAARLASSLVNVR